MLGLVPFIRLISTLLCSIALCTSLRANLDIYLDIPAVDGDSQTKEFDGWTQLLGVTNSGSNTITLSPTGASAGRFSPKALTLDLAMSAAHPYMAARVTDGAAVPEMRIQVVRADSAVLVEYVFYNVHFESANATSSKGLGISSKITFFYTKIEWSVVKFDEIGKAKEFNTVSYDAAKNIANFSTMSGEITAGGDSSGGGGGSDTDLDDDGMPNSWENDYGLDPNSNDDRNTDLDHDGFSNYIEYLAGTIPNDSTSFLKITQLNISTAQLEWASAAGRVYQVQQAVGGLEVADWKTLAEVTASAGSTSSYTLPNTSTQNQVFYRVRLKP